MRRRRAKSPAVPAGPETDTAPAGPPSEPATAGSAPILIVSASMGAGHDGAARSLAEKLRESGHPAIVEDFLCSGPLRIGFALRKGYEFELRHVPSAYDATYRLWYRVPWLCPAVAWLVTLLTRRRLLRWVRDTGAAAVVSTYPLATLCIGRLRQKGRFPVPAVNFITDFGVHPLWVHKGIDLNLAVHQAPADVAWERTGRPSIACGPVVSDRFDPERLPSRTEARRRFGIGDDERAVLVVAGSWGIGNITATWRAVSSDPRFTPVVVCGRDENLLRHLTALANQRTGGGRSLILGWTEDMPSLMVACDALVENAGGLTSLEAMRAGLPVISFDPIAGHGRENTAAMDTAGVGRLARDAAQLVEALIALTEDGPQRQEQVAAAAATFQADAAALVLREAAVPAPQPARARRLSPLRAAVAAVALGGVCWAGLTTGVAVATEAGAGVTRPTPGSPDAYVGVRLNAAEIADPAVVSQLRTMGLTAVIDQVTAAQVPTAVRALGVQGVSLAAGGAGEGNDSQTDAGQRAAPPGDDGSPWTRAWFDARAAQTVGGLAGEPVEVTILGRRLDAWDLIQSSDAHTALVVPDHILHVGEGSPPPGRVVAGNVYLVQGLAATPAELLSYLTTLYQEATASGIPLAPLADLGGDAR